MQPIEETTREYIEEAEQIGKLIEKLEAKLTSIKSATDRMEHQERISMWKRIQIEMKLTGRMYGGEPKPDQERKNR